MVINELAQWAAILFLGIMVFGLTRQLGQYMLGPRERAALDMGPAVGSSLPDGLLTPGERASVSALMSGHGTLWAALLTVDSGCETCTAILSRVKDEGMPDGAPLITIARLADAQGLGPAETAMADLALVDPKRVNAAHLGTPFLMIIDDSFVVQYKALATHVADAVASWRGTSVTIHTSPGGNGASQPLGVTEEVEVGK